MIKNIIVVLILIGIFSLEAAAPVTHVYLTKRFFKAFPKYTKKEQNAFMVGTLFPDIRYLGEASRETTHFHGLTLHEVLAETDPFMAGVKFHSYVDEVREALLVEAKLYDKVREKVPLHTATFIKLAEDEALYQESYLSDVLVSLIDMYPQEKQFKISDETLSKWHKLLTHYMVTSPSVSLNLWTLTGKGAAGISAEEFKSWNTLLKSMCKEMPLDGWIKDMVRHFDEAYAQEAH